MTKDILLIYPRYSYPRKSPPLGLAYLAAYLEAAGFKPQIIDFNVMILNREDFIQYLNSKPWLLIGISFMTNQFAEARILAKVIKQTLAEIFLVIGGPHASSIPELTMQQIPEIDIIVKGEGEETLRELALNLSEGNSIESIAGLYLRKNDHIMRTPEREFIRNLDKIPYPAWKYLDVRKYKVMSIADHEEAPTFALLSSRGCPNNCIFCDSHTIFARQFRARSADNIFKEIMYLHNTYGMTVFDFVDDLVTINKKRMFELCAFLKTSGVLFQWMANARVNTVDHEMLKAMKDAGCIRIDFGVESGDLNVRKIMNKNITNEQIINAHRMSRELGISTGSFTMVGNLGETKESVKLTVELLQEIGDDVMVSIACPYPGTELYKIAKENNFLITEDWTRYVTSPTYMEGYRPVMRTEYMSEEEILEVFYYLHSFFAARKFKRRFGKVFWVNPAFYKEWVFNPKGIRNRFNMALKLVSSRLKATKPKRG